MPTPYEVLGVEPTASDAEIRRAYVALARRFHPDANPAGEERMRAVNEAWAVLGDPRRRAQLDRGPTPDPGFRPDDPTDDDVDPRIQPDVPYRPHSEEEVQRFSALTLAPVAVFGTAVASFGAGLFFASPVLMGAGVVLFSAACLGLIAVLLLAMVNARRDEG
jgi:hypothetical protein